MTWVREKRQSISPTWQVVLGMLGIAVVLAAVWFAVSAAVSAGGDDCAAKDSQSTTERCR